MKTLKEIEKGLSETYDGPTYEKNGFTYIPWNEATKAANEVFGIDGYNVEVIDVHQEGPGFLAKVRVTVYTSDGGAFSREGVGYNEMTGENGRAYDTAVKGAVSDALNRAWKLFGKRFGLNLYDKGDVHPDSSQRTTSAPRSGQSQSSGDYLDRRPSEKQMAVLNKAGYDEEQVDAMDFKTWKAVIDAIFAKTAPPVAPAAKQATAKKSAPKAAQPEELEFDDASDLPF